MRGQKEFSQLDDLNVIQLMQGGFSVTLHVGVVALWIEELLQDGKKKDI